MMPQTRPVANFRQERLSENDMNQKLQMMEMHRSAQEPYRPQPHQTPPQPQQPYYPPQQQHVPTRQVTPRQPKAPQVRIRTFLETIKILPGDKSFHLPPKCVSAQMIQAWVPKMTYLFKLPEQQLYRTVFIKEHDSLTNSKYTIPLVLPQASYTSIDEVVKALNVVAKETKALRYSVSFLKMEDRISIQLSGLNNIDNDPDTFDRIHGDYRNVTGLSVVWQADSILAGLLGYTKNSPLFSVDAFDSVQYDAETKWFPLDEVPFFHFNVPDYMTSDVILQPPESNETYKGQTFENDEGILTFASNLQEAQMERTEPIMCSFTLRHPTTDHIQIEVSPNKVLFVRMRLKLSVHT